MKARLLLGLSLSASCILTFGCGSSDSGETYVPSLLFSPDVFNVDATQIKSLDKSALEMFLENTVRSPRGGCKFFDYFADSACSETVKEVVVKEPHLIVLRGVSTSGTDAMTGPVKAWTKVEYMEFTCANATFDKIENKELEGVQNLFKFCPNGAGTIMYLLKTDLSYGEGVPKKHAYTGLSAATGAPCHFAKEGERLDLSPGCLFQELSWDNESDKVLVWKEESGAYYESLTDVESLERGKTKLYVNEWQGEGAYHESNAVSFQLSKNDETVTKEFSASF